MSRVTSFPKANADKSLLRSGAERLAFLGAVDAAQADTLMGGVVQDFNRVAVEDGDDGTGEVGKDQIRQKHCK
jgi:hypothetical protein